MSLCGCADLQLSISDLHPVILLDSQALLEQRSVKRTPNNYLPFWTGIAIGSFCPKALQFPILGSSPGYTAADTLLKYSYMSSYAVTCADLLLSCLLSESLLSSFLSPENDPSYSSPFQRSFVILTSAWTEETIFQNTCEETRLI